ncbi:MAG: AIR synthase, partial [Thermoanaerobacteraceae bacterium]|nr:AIR synthase [Thermoanaerobacteraceae bacterium]
ASGCGAKVYKNEIPVLKETKLICEHFDLDPLKLISSGCMLIACENGVRLTEELSDNGIKAVIIGKLTREKNIILSTDYQDIMIQPPESDELYKVSK